MLLISNRHRLPRKSHTALLQEAVPLAGLLVLCAPHAHAQTMTTNYLYIADYNNGDVTRYIYTPGGGSAPNYGATAAPATGQSGAIYIPKSQIGNGNGNTEGMGGIDNYLAVASNSGTINIFNVASSNPAPVALNTLTGVGSALKIAFNTNQVTAFGTNNPTGYLTYIANNGVEVYDTNYTVSGGTKLASITSAENFAKTGTNTLSTWGVAYQATGTNTGSVYFTSGWGSSGASVSGGVPSGSTNSSSGVYMAGANLSNPTEIVNLNAAASTYLATSALLFVSPNAAGTITSFRDATNSFIAPAGIVMDTNGDGGYWVVSGSNSDEYYAIVDHFNKNNLLDAQYIPPYYGTSSASTMDPIYDGFDVQIGPDGGVYICGQGAKCVVEILPQYLPYAVSGVTQISSTNTDGFTYTSESGYSLYSGNSPFATIIPQGGTGGNTIGSSKALFLNSDTITTSNLPFVPEPSIMVVAIVGLVGGGALLLRRRRNRPEPDWGF